MHVQVLSSQLFYFPVIYLSVYVVVCVGVLTEAESERNSVVDSLLGQYSQ